MIEETAVHTRQRGHSARTQTMLQAVRTLDAVPTTCARCEDLGLNRLLASCLVGGRPFCAPCAQAHRAQTASPASPPRSIDARRALVRQWRAAR